MEVTLSLGSNLGDRLHTLQQAVALINSIPECHILAHSPIYESAHVGDSPQNNPPAFLNSVAALTTTLEPVVLLQKLHKVEQTLGRTRSATDHTGEPRTLDIDIITCGELQLNLPELTIPHPRAHQRRFVLQPLADIRPHMVIPGQTLNVLQLLQTLSNQSCQKIGQ